MATAAADQAAQQEGWLIPEADQDGIVVQVSLTVWVVQWFSRPAGVHSGSVAPVVRSRPRPGERYSSSDEPGTSYDHVSI